jgi:hypothetical protein
MTARHRARDVSISSCATIKETILFHLNLMHQDPVPNEAFSILFPEPFDVTFERAIGVTSSFSVNQIYSLYSFFYYDC